MKAWHVQDTEGERQQIIFAKKRSDAIQKSEAIGWTEFINVRAKRAKYCDDLEKEPCAIIQAQLEHGWWLECNSNKCVKQLTIEDEYAIIDGRIYCEKCSEN